MNRFRRLIGGTADSFKRRVTAEFDPLRTSAAKTHWGLRRKIVEGAADTAFLGSGYCSPHSCIPSLIRAYTKSAKVIACHNL
jgi:hypothetical protein